MGSYKYEITSFFKCLAVNRLLHGISNNDLKGTRNRFIMYT